MSPRSLSKVAAVDLGSNSFHLFVARVIDGRLHIVDRLKQRVQLAAGLDDRGNLTPATRKRGIECLREFGARIRPLPDQSVRAVGTNTLRTAKNAKLFLRNAEKALGHSIEVISGKEEARLIYLGVSHSIAENVGKRLVIDIGGGSTECILGRQFEPLDTASVYMGCVSYSLNYFPHGTIRDDQMERAEIAAQLEFEALATRYRSMKWTTCIGSSGTILATEQILRANGWAGQGISREGLDRLRKELIGVGSVKRLSLMRGISADRAPVYPGGFAILRAAFEAFGISHMQTSTGALREGLVYDLLGRIGHEDVRDSTIQQFAERYHVDLEQAARIERMALGFLHEAAPAWKLDVSVARQFLSWASRLFEVGLSISFSGYHKHSAYIIENADMPGFSRQDQMTLASIILGHRRKVSGGHFSSLGIERAHLARSLCVLLRIAVLLYRSRRPRAVPRVRMTIKKNRLQLRFPEGWIVRHPLTQADLDEEKLRLQSLGLTLEAR